MHEVEAGQDFTALLEGKSTADAPIKVLIAEDDTVQRAALISLVRTLRPEWQVVADVGTVGEFKRAVDLFIPDLCLIDIHLSSSADPDWIKNLDGDLAVIFVTGDPDYAVHAFDCDAIDYILKPITPRRLKAALDRAARDPRVQGLRHFSPAELGRPYLSRITMTRGTETIVAMPDDIAYLEADMKYTRVVTTRGAGLVRVGINELSARLPSDQFLRIHRGYVVNLKFVASVKRNEFGYLEVYLNDRPEILRVSKSYQHVFRPD